MAAKQYLQKSLVFQRALMNIALWLAVAILEDILKGTRKN